MSEMSTSTNVDYYTRDSKDFKEIFIKKREPDANKYFLSAVYSNAQSIPARSIIVFKVFEVYEILSNSATTRNYFE